MRFMKFLNNLIRVIVFIAWSLVVFYIAKALGFTYDPESDSMLRTFMRVILVVIIMGGAYFIWKVNFIKKRKNQRPVIWICSQIPFINLTSKLEGINILLLFWLLHNSFISDEKKLVKKIPYFGNERFTSFCNLSLSCHHRKLKCQ